MVKSLFSRSSRLRLQYINLIKTMMQESNWNFDENMFPVFKFDMNNKLIYTNVAALPLMKEWKCKINEKLPSELVSKYPEIFHASISHQAQDLTIPCNEYLMHFSLVPFPEAGYIGMYGFSIELKESYVLKDRKTVQVNTNWK